MVNQARNTCACLPGGLSDTGTAKAGKAEVLGAAFISVFPDTLARHFSLEAGAPGAEEFQ